MLRSTPALLPCSDHPSHLWAPCRPAHPSCAVPVTSHAGPSGRRWPSCCSSMIFMWKFLGSSDSLFQCFSKVGPFLSPVVNPFSLKQCGHESKKCFCADSSAKSCLCLSLHKYWVPEIGVSWCGPSPPAVCPGCRFVVPGPTEPGPPGGPVMVLVPPEKTPSQLCLLRGLVSGFLALL